MKQILVLAVFIFSSFSIQAQYGGVDRSIGGPGQFQTGKKKDKKSDFDFVQASTDKMTKELSLDDFQKAAVKNIIDDYKNQVMSITVEEIPDTGKSEKMNTAKDKMEAKIRQLLNKEQLLKFENLKNKAEKKDKGKKKDSPEADEKKD
ncbi:hypothetical protein [Flavobacterium magnum]|nr:hypothetical protein [Flavobacterium magnum]